MNTLVFLIPIALFLGALGLGAFLWSLKSGQYDDVEGAAWRVLDDGDERYKGIKDWQRHGSVYGVVAAKPGHQKPVGEWNEEEIIVKGSHVKVILNGTTIVDADTAEAATPKTLDGREHPGLKRDKGFIAFCGHGAHVEYKNLRLKELK